MRDSGILLPVASLPSKYGVGDLGSSCLKWIDLLAENGVRIWQILPVNPLGFGNSPYQPYSAFAGDELYISLEELYGEGLLEELPRPFREEAGRIDYKESRNWKEPFLRKAFLEHEKRQRNGVTEKKADDSHLPWNGDRFATADTSKGDDLLSKWSWLRPYAVYRAFRKANKENCWNRWADWQRFWPADQEAGKADGQRFQSADRKVGQADWEEEIRYQIFLQEVFYRQWMRVKKYAVSKGIQIMGDIPFYVGLDSADVWMNPNCFALDSHGEPLLVAGVPPDYFSETGQRWGNPIYNWEQMEKDHYLFWRERLKYAAHLFDVIRLDHFRAFDTYWSIPASCPTAVEGKWVEAPGYQALDAILEEIPREALVVEDLGALRPQVELLKNHYGFHGMKILQFTMNFKGKKALDTMRDKANVIACPGNHDNATLVEWQRQLTPSQRRKLRRFLKEEGCSGQGGAGYGILRYLLRSPASRVVIPLGDLLKLGVSGRLNVPGTVGSPDWEWRLSDFKRAERLMALFRQELMRAET